jgi:hypothetical protein
MHPFLTTSQVFDAMPSAALLFPWGGTKIQAMLGVVDPFNVWVVVLFAISFKASGNIATSRAIAFGALVGICPQLITRLFWG